jgi:hypothetical protein
MFRDRCREAILKALRIRRSDGAIPGDTCRRRWPTLEEDAKADA